MPALNLSSIASTLGSLYAGLFVMAVLYGVTTLQCYIYFRTYPEDRRSIKYLVAALWVIDTIHTILTAQGVYQELSVAMLSSPINLFLNPIPITLTVSQIFTTLSDTCVRGFYCSRIWRISRKNRALTGLMTIFSIPPFAFGIVFAVRLFRLPSLLEFPSLSVVIYCILSTIAVSDWSITIVLSALLWKQHSSIKRTNTLINILIAYTISTGLLPSVVAITMIITFALNLGLVWFACSLYSANCISAVFLQPLNNRLSLRTHNHSDEPMSIPLSGLLFHPPGNASVDVGEASHPVGQDHQIMVKVDTDVHQRKDPPSTVSGWPGVV